MKPILFNENETRFDTYGLGEIDVLNIQVERIRNGNYTIYFEYPANGPLASIFKNGMQIKADAGTRTKNQTFDITRVVKNSGKTIKVYGRHIKHRLEKIVFRNGQAFGGSASTALATLKNVIVGDNDWDVASDITTTGKGVFDISKMGSVHSALGGVEGSILDIYGGEYEFDNRTIRLHKQLGRTAPTVLEYGRNILSVESDESIEGVYTTVYPFASYTPETQGDTGGRTPEPVVVELPEKVVDSKYRPLYTHQKIKVVDFSSSFKEKEIPTAEKLRKLATDYMNNNEIGKPKLNVKIEYVDLASTLDSATKQVMEEIELCDIIPVYYPPLGITSNDAKVVRVVYNPVLERNTSVEFGQIGSGIKSAMTGNLSAQVADIAKNQQQLVNSLPDYLLNAQGNKVWYNRPDENTEHKVGDIWFEKNGLYDRMYIWNGSMWEKRIDTEDVDNIKKEVEKKLAESKQATDDAMDRTRAIADLALQQSGSDSIELASKKIIKQVLDGKLFDSSFKKAVNKTFEEDDNGSTIYGKISSEIEKKFITIDATDSRFRQVSEQVDSKVSGVNDKLTQTNRTLVSTISDVNQAKTDISNTRLRINDANQKIDKADKKINDVDVRVDQANRKLESANVRIDKTNIALEGTNGRIDQTNTDLANTNAQVEANKRQIEVQVTNFNAVRESTKLFERILGTTEEGAPDKLSRLVMSSEIFQTEVGKYVTDDNNLIVNSMTMETNTRVNDNKNGVEVTLNNGVFSIKARGLTRYNWTGFTLPIYVKKIYRGETYTLGFKYRIREKVDTNFVFVVKNHKINKGLLSADIANANTPASGNWIEFQRTFTVQEDFAFGEEANYPFYIYISKNGWVEFKEPILVRGSNTGPYKPSQFDDAYRSVEATRTQVTQLAGSWAVRNLTNSGDVLNSINLLANGTNRIDGRLTHITGQTVIDNAVIKDGMIEKVSANKLTAGTIDAREINLINVNARSVTSGTFKGLTYEGGIIRGNNGNTIINLNDNVTTYNGTAKIEFKSPHNTLEFNSNGRKAFLAPTISLGSNYPAFAFGINDRGEANSNNNFVGLKIFNQPGYRKIVLIGDVHIVKDSVNDNAPYVSLADLFKRINDNFKKLHAFRVQYNEGSPGFFDVSL
jgi:phage minor structural protein